MKISHLFLCTLLFIFSSCDDETPEPLPVETIGLMTATVEGMEIKSTLGTSNIQQLGTTGQQFSMTGPTGINPLTAGFLNFNFFLPVDEDLEVMSYSFVDADCTVTGDVTEICGTVNVSATAIELDEGYSSSCTGCSLDITITEVDFQNEGRIKGTFTGMVESVASGDIVPLTAGEFNVVVTE
jgi:hypothetical protein